jgi:hypothetical protein
VYSLVIPEPQVTEPELLQENKNDIVGNKILHCGKLMDMFNKFYKEHGQNEPRCELSTGNLFDDIVDSRHSEVDFFLNLGCTV